ncbi:MAG: MBL fold metallo-hydrolase [Rhodocyclaceae bacterium]|nr:MBL fold metallo-hydrolase [Rhodocyclaceae bacterium]
MKFQFLGTSSGVPTTTRSLSALAIQAPGRRRWLLVDCGEGTQHRLLHSGFSPATLDAVLITHRHGDHCLGLPGLLAHASMNGRSEPLTIVAPDEVRRFVQGALALTDSRLDFELAFVDVACSDAPLGIAGLLVSTVPLSHRVPSFAFALREQSPPRRLDRAGLLAAGVPPGPLWGRLQRGEDVLLDDGRLLEAARFAPEANARCVVVAGDNDTPELLADACRDAQVLVHEATYTSDVATRIGPAPMHSCAARVARFAAAAALPNLVLTHFSPRYRDHGRGPLIADVAREAAAHYAGTLHLARDLDLCELADDGGLSVTRFDRSAAPG